MPDDPLDPRHLARSTGYSYDAWKQALDQARNEDIPEPALIGLVIGGAWPGLIRSVGKAHDAIALMVSATVKATDAFDCLERANTQPPTDVRGRSLWLKERRGTGPDLGAIDQRRRR